MIWRAVVGWLLHSKLRFFGVLVAAVAGALLVSSLGSSGAPTDGGGELAAPASASPSTEQARGAAQVTQNPSSEPPRQLLLPRELAKRVAELWVDTSGSQAEWLARLRPLVTDEYGAVTLAQVDPRNVPAKSVVGDPEMVGEADRGVAVAEVPLDALTLRVEMVDTGAGGWKATELAPANEPGGGA